MQDLNKKGTSFGSIVAVMGSALIALGVVWLVAQNWHIMPSAVKITILFVATAAAYSAGVILRLKNFKGLGHSLIILGTLLYTISIFLIAQIFSTSVTAQGTAWLFLLSWVGVTASAYLLTSPGGLVIGLIEILIWLIIQFFAFTEYTRNSAQPGILAFYLLIAGVLVYGLSLWHRAKGKEFSRLYLWWTVFYFLAFTYILSFQSLLPILWLKDAVFSLPATLFLVFFAILGAIALATGILTSVKNKSVNKKEMIGMAVIIVSLAVLIGLTSFTSNTIGVCDKKACYDYYTIDECRAAPDNLSCVWNQGFCNMEDCFYYKTAQSCINQTQLNCIWRDNMCSPKPCEQIRDKASCDRTSEKIPCYWQNNTCIEKNCYQYQTEPECNSSNVCKWDTSYGREFCVYEKDYNYCSIYTDKYEECSANPSCTWRAGNYYGRGRNVPGILWAVWIIINIAFLALILAIIGYGTLIKSSSLINIGIVFFALNIVTRYIGFIIDLWGYTSLALIFISGGIILLAGGYFIEKWRRNLIKKTRK